MADDFRTQLKYTYLDDPTRLCFEDIILEPWFVLSIQARPFYEETPMEPRDPMEIERFHISLMNRKGIIHKGKWAVWDALKDHPWAHKFHLEANHWLLAENMTVAETQAMFDDLSAFAASHPLPE